MMFKRIGIAIALLCCTAAATTKNVESEVHASNGIPVTISADDAAQRYEYTAPAITLSENRGFFLVAAVDHGGTKTPVMVSGTLMYRGDWRFYDQALFQGGEELPGTFDGRHAFSCASSQGCMRSENFKVEPTAAHIQKHAENGMLPVELRARGLNPVVIHVPVSHFDAVREVLAAN
jgi:hypothetical protein